MALPYSPCLHGSGGGPEQAQCSIDIHLHDEGTLGAWEIDLILEYTKALNLQGRVTISHAFALATIPLAHQQRLAAGLAENQISVVTAVPFDRKMLPSNVLLDAGVVLGLGNDNIQDLWSPYGDGDILKRAFHLAYRSEWRNDDTIKDALDIATAGGARVLGLEGHGTEPGSAADLIIASARTAGELVARHPTRRGVVKNGTIAWPEP